MTGPGVLHLTTFLQGGAGRAITELACAQHEAGYDVTVVASDTAHAEFGNYPEYLDRLRDSGITLHTCDSLFVRDVSLNMRVAEMLCANVNGGDLDIIHAHAAVPAFVGQVFATSVPRRVPVVQTQHGWGINKTAAQAAFDLEMLRRVDRVIVTSQATRNLLEALGLPAAPIAVIPCGLAARERPGPSEAAERLLAPLRARGLRLAGCIGTVTANKNQRLLLQALPMLDADLAVVFVGEGSETLIAEAADRGVADRVVACGYQPDAAGWLPLLDLLVAPSRTEGQGLVVLEAFRAGVPVVASAIAAFIELIDDGRNGILFADDDPAALAGAIRSLLDMPAAARARLSGAAKSRFEHGYTLAAMIERHHDLYRDVVRGARVEKAS